MKPIKINKDITITKVAPTHVHYTYKDTEVRTEHASCTSELMVGNKIEAWLYEWGRHVIRTRINWI